MIRQFDVFANPIRVGRADRPYLVTIQHKSLDAAQSRLLAPLSIAHAFHHLPRLNPAFRILDQLLYLDPMGLITLTLRHLREPVANLEAERDRIIAAIDLVLTGI